MNRLLSFLTIALVLCFAACSSNNQSADNATNGEDAKTTKTEKTKPSSKIMPLEIGTTAPSADHKMKDISGKEISMNDVKGENGVLVIFSCNTCPYVIAWEDRYPQIAKNCAENGIGLLVVNPNEKQRDDKDSFEAMVEHAKEVGYDFPYVVDEYHQLADAMGATKTPDLFLFDGDLKLVYRGAIDDNMKQPEKVSNYYIQNAVNNLKAGAPIDPNTTKAIGCSIKRVEQVI